MRTRAERERELQAMMGSRQGINEIMELWQEKVIGIGRMGPVGTLASQMISQILDKEFPHAPEAAVPHSVELIDRSKSVEVGTVIFSSLRIDGSHEAVCRPEGVLQPKQIKRIAESLIGGMVVGREDNL